MPCGSSRSDSAAITLRRDGQQLAAGLAEAGDQRLGFGAGELRRAEEDLVGRRAGVERHVQQLQAFHQGSTRRPGDTCAGSTPRASTTRLLPVLVMVGGCCAVVMVALRFSGRRAVPGSWFLTPDSCLLILAGSIGAMPRRVNSRASGQLPPTPRPSNHLTAASVPC